MKKQYVKPVVTVVKMTESHAIMAGSVNVKLNGFIENDPTTAPDGDKISIYWGGTQKDDTPKEGNGFLWGD